MARNLWGTISEELKTLEIMGSVATGAGSGVRDFCPDSKKKRKLYEGLIVLCHTTNNRRRIL